MLLFFYFNDFGTPFARGPPIESTWADHGQLFLPVDHLLLQENDVS